MMRVILDTNVLVAALMVSGGPPHLLLEAFLNDRFTLVTSAAQLEEFSRVTRYPAIRSRIRPAQAGRLLNAIRCLAAQVEKVPVADISRDPHDNFLFAMAQAAQVDYLVSGDNAGVLALRRIGTTRIVTARRMVAILKIQ